MYMKLDDKHNNIIKKVQDGFCILLPKKRTGRKLPQNHKLRSFSGIIFTIICLNF